MTLSNGTSSPDHILLKSKPFKLPVGKSVARASCYVVGLGYYKLHLDGTPLSTHHLGAFTTFEKRVLYDTWDATHLLGGGSDGNSEGSGGDGSSEEHVVAVEVGPGFYTQRR